MATRRQGRSIDRGTRRGGRTPPASGFGTGAAPTESGDAASVDVAADAEFHEPVADGEPAVSAQGIAVASPDDGVASAEDAPVTVHGDGEPAAVEHLADGAAHEALPSGHGDGEIAPLESAPSNLPLPAVAADEPTAIESPAAVVTQAPDEPTQAEQATGSESLLPSEIESAIASAQPGILPPPRAAAVLALTEITAANDTLAAFLRNEGIATFAHWRALSTAKSPGDAIRLQVTEFQRAADASLNCMASLARRAGRIAATVGRG